MCMRDLCPEIYSSYPDLHEAVDDDFCKAIEMIKYNVSQNSDNYIRCKKYFKMLFLKKIPLKLVLECSTKIFYTRKKEYPDTNKILTFSSKY